MQAEDRHEHAGAGVSEWQPSQRYPDPAVHVVDESFARYKLNL
jgi:gluconolactonase